MSSGLPCIATNWSGQTEYMNEFNSFPLKINGLETTKGSIPWDHNWASPSETHLKELMRFAFNNRNIVKERGKNARKTMERRYSHEIMGKIIFEQFLRILNKWEMRKQDNEQHDL